MTTNQQRHMVVTARVLAMGTAGTTSVVEEHELEPIGVQGPMPNEDGFVHWGIEWQGHFIEFRVPLALLRDEPVTALIEYCDDQLAQAATRYPNGVTA